MRKILITLLFVCSVVNAGPLFLLSALTALPPFTNLHSLQWTSTLSQYVDVGPAAALNIDYTTTAASFGCWVNFPTIGSPGYTIMGNVSSTAPHAGMLLQGGSIGMGDLVLYLNNNYNGGNAIAVATAAVLTANVWHHVDVTVSAPHAANVTFYVDAVSKPINTIYADSLTSSTVSPINFYLGASPNATGFAGGSYFNGNVDECYFVAGTALSGAQITSIYNGGTAATLAPYSPTSWWRFETNLNDSGSAGNNGTGINSPTYSTSVP